MIFDWNYDDQLADLTWSDVGESDDHVVPPDENENKSSRLYGDNNKEWEMEAAQVKPDEQKKRLSKAIHSHVVKQGCNSQCTTHGGVLAAGLGSGPDFSSLNSQEVEINIMDNERVNKTAHISNYESSRCDEKSEPGESLELCTQHEEEVESDTVNYEWANISSFDDLDRIFSSNDQVFGHVSIGNAEEPLLSAKDVTTSQEMSVSSSLDSPSPSFGALGSKPDRFEIKDEHLQYLDFPTPGFQKMTNSSHSTLGVKDSMINFESVVGRSQPIAKSKVNGQRNLLKSQKILARKSESTLKSFCGSCSTDGSERQQYDNQVAAEMGQPSLSMIFQQKKLHGPESSQYKESTNSILTLDHTRDTQYSAMPALPLFHSMTPQEKIAKLRSRQKIRAMVAIQKQQQQFSHQSSSTDTRISPRCENQIQLMAGGSEEINGNCSILPSADQYSPVEHNGTNIFHRNIDKCSIEDTILYQLQDVINKLDIQIRLCIRDSLFRLALSSIQRLHGSDISSTKRTDESKEGIINCKRPVNMAGETETNPIDRTVAHLLFHRATEESSGTVVMPESPFPTNLPCEAKATTTLSFAEGFGYRRESSVHSPCLFVEGAGSKSTYSNTSENASNYQTATCEPKQIEEMQ